MVVEEEKVGGGGEEGCAVRRVVWDLRFEGMRVGDVEIFYIKI